MKVLSVFLFGFIILLSVFRFACLTCDPPYQSLSPGVVFTDEGWYTKSAQLLVKKGFWSNPEDINFYTHSPVYTLFIAGVFKLFGIGIIQARLVSVIASFISLYFFYLICRKHFNLIFSLSACLVILSNVPNIGFSRMAILEPIGTTLSLMALWFWIRSDHFLNCVWSLICASLALFVKTSFSFTFASVAILWLFSICSLYQAKEKTRALFILTMVITACFSVFALQIILKMWGGVDWERFQDINITRRLTILNNDPFQLFHNQYSQLKLLFFDPSFTIPCVLLFFCFIGVFYTHPVVLLSLSRSHYAMLIWGLMGLIATGMLPFQLKNYYYFCIYPITYWCIAFIDLLCKVRLKTAALLTFVCLQMILQIPSFKNWAMQSPYDSYALMAEDIQQKMGEPSSQVVVMGSIATTLALFDPFIYPVESYYAKYLPIFQRMAHWQPKFLILYKGEREKDFKNLPPFVKELKFLSEYRVMSSQVNVEFYQIVYSSKPS